MLATEYVLRHPDDVASLTLCSTAASVELMMGSVLPLYAAVDAEGVPPEQFMDAFLQWPTGPFPGAPELLDEVRGTVPIGCLSNTNTAHWEYQVATWPILELFEYRFLSFDLGLVKPDPALFEEVAARLPVPRDRVLFLDDNAMNADAARTAGFLAGHVRGVDEAREALVRMGVVEA